MKTERYLIEKIIKKSVEIFVIPLSMMIGLPYVMGFYYEPNVYIKLKDITVELGEKLPEEVNRYADVITNGSDLAIESSAPVDEEGNTTMLGKFNYYLVYNDDNYRYSKLTNVKSSITVVDTIKPIITVKENVEFDYNSEFKLSDVAECFDLSGCKMSISEEVDTTKSGEKEIHITAIDGGNNTSTATAKFKVKEKAKPVVYYYVPYYSLNIEQNNIKNASLSEEEKSSLRVEVASFAKQFIGNPYVYGGTSLTNGTDCSGFTMSVYANFGYSLPRSSSDYYGVGRAVSESELLPGDIVVYPGHVGLYVGGGMMVHAATPAQGIVYAPMYDDYRVYRRIID